MWLDELNALCAQPPCLSSLAVGRSFCYCAQSKTFQFSPGVWDFNVELIVRDPEEHGLPSSAVPFGLCHTQCTSHFRTLESQRAVMSLHILLTVQNHYLLMMRHGLRIAADSRFWLVSVKASISSVTGNSLHLEWGFVAVPPFFLESPWRVQFYRLTDRYLGQKNSSRIVLCKKKSRLNPPPTLCPPFPPWPRNALDSFREIMEMPVDLGFPVSFAARNPMGDGDLHTTSVDQLSFSILYLSIF